MNGASKRIVGFKSESDRFLKNVLSEFLCFGGMVAEKKRACRLAGVV